MRVTLCLCAHQGNDNVWMGSDAVLGLELVLVTCSTPVLFFNIIIRVQ